MGDRVVVGRNDLNAQLGKGIVVSDNFIRGLRGETEYTYIQVSYPSGRSCFVRHEHVTFLRTIPR